MKKKIKKSKKQIQELNVAKQQKDKPPEISEESERLFKIILKIMSWIVGTSFILIIILPQFNDPTLDRITQVLYYIGIINLLLFTLIEFITDSVKSFLTKLIRQSSK